MNTNVVCDHKWKAAGLWDGKDPITQQKTGGVWYKCELCEQRVNSIEQAKGLGGTVDENTDVFGHSTKKTV